MGKYAVDTEVSVERSRAEIETTLKRYGAQDFMYASSTDKAMIAFTMNGKQVRFVLFLPDQHAREFTHTPERGTPRSKDNAFRAWEQACRQRWRALSLAIKAKLEAVECGISVFEQEFLANIVLPDNTVVADFMLPQIETAYLSGKMPDMIPLLAGGNSRG